jgi:hypothetical protein
MIQTNAAEETEARLFYPTRFLPVSLTIFRISKEKSDIALHFVHNEKFCLLGYNAVESVGSQPMFGGICSLHFKSQRTTKQTKTPLSR